MGRKAHRVLQRQPGCRNIMVFRQPGFLHFDFRGKGDYYGSQLTIITKSINGSGSIIIDFASTSRLWWRWWRRFSPCCQHVLNRDGEVSITDKTSDNYQNVVISIREIRVVPAGRENSPDNDPGLPVIARFATPRVIDVMQLQFVQQALGDVVLPSGTYSQIRLILEPNPNGQGQQLANYLVLKSTLSTKDSALHSQRPKSV